MHVKDLILNDFSHDFSMFNFLQPHNFNQNVKIFQVKSQIYAGQSFSLFRSRPFLQSTLQSASNQLTTGGQRYFLALHIFPR